ncbi:MAG: MoaD/ThiS family protein [Paracoccaceae bacterium]
MIDVVYFAWVRERIGAGSERVEEGATDVAALVEALRARSPAHDMALSDLSALRCAVDRRMTGWDAPLEGAREVAIFPPMTGG